eukprot:gene644-687_t
MPDHSTSLQECQVRIRQGSQGSMVVFKMLSRGVRAFTAYRKQEVSIRDKCKSSDTPDRDRMCDSTDNESSSGDEITSPLSTCSSFSELHHHLAAPNVDNLVKIEDSGKEEDNSSGDTTSISDSCDEASLPSNDIISSLNSPPSAPIKVKSKYYLDIAPVAVETVGAISYAEGDNASQQSPFTTPTSTSTTKKKISSIRQNDTDSIFFTTQGLFNSTNDSGINSPITSPTIDITSNKTTPKKTYFHHPPEIRQKISDANKGRAPWNVGKQHSEETRRKIAQRNTEIAYQRKIEQAKELNITLEEFELLRKRRNRESSRERKREQLRQLSRLNSNNSYSNNNINRNGNSNSNGYNNDYPRFSRKGFSHSEETRKLLSEKTKQLWQERYNNLTLGLLGFTNNNINTNNNNNNLITSGGNITALNIFNLTYIDIDKLKLLHSNGNSTVNHGGNITSESAIRYIFHKRQTSPETRAKLSAIMKERHRNRLLQEENNNNNNLGYGNNLSDSNTINGPSSWRRMNETWKKLLSEKIKQKWNDPEYVIKVRQGIIERHYSNMNKPLSNKSRKNLINKVLRYYPNTTIIAIAGINFYEQEKKKITNDTIRNSDNTTLIEETLINMFENEKSRNHIYSSSNGNNRKNSSRRQARDSVIGNLKRNSRSNVLILDDTNKLKQNNLMMMMDDDTRNRQLSAKELSSRARRNRRKLELLLDSKAFESDENFYSSEGGDAEGGEVKDGGDDSISDEKSIDISKSILDEDSTDSDELNQAFFLQDKKNTAKKEVTTAALLGSSKLKRRVKEKATIQIDDEEFYQDDYDAEEFEYYYDDSVGNDEEMVERSKPLQRQKVIASQSIISDEDTEEDDEEDEEESEPEELLDEVLERESKSRTKILADDDEEEDEEENPLPYFVDGLGEEVEEEEEEE